MALVGIGARHGVRWLSANRRPSRVSMSTGHCRYKGDSPNHDPSSLEQVATIRASLIHHMKYPLTRLQPQLRSFSSTEAA